MNYSGVDQPLPSQPNSKTGVSSVIYGGTGTTAFSVENSGSAKWHRGFVAKQEAIASVAFGVVKSGTLGDWNFRVSPSGDATVATLASGKAGFNGTPPVGKCKFPAALPTNGRVSDSAFATALNSLRACLMANGLEEYFMNTLYITKLCDLVGAELC